MGATGRANDDTKALFNLIWNNVSNTWSVIQDSSGNPTMRGANADVDFNANKRLPLTKALGRAIAILGSGNGLTARALGEFLGEENHQLTIAELASHVHSYTFLQTTGASGVGGGTPNVAAGFNTGAAGGNQPHNNMQPTAFVNVMIKL